MEGHGMILEDEAPVNGGNDNGLNLLADDGEPVEQIDEMEADACIQKIENWERYRKYWLDWYAKKIEQVNEKCDRNIEWQKRKLRFFFKFVPHRNTKSFEAFDLPSGRLTMPFPKKKMVPDKASILARFEKDGDEEFIKVKKDVDWDGYRKRLYINDDGSVIDKETGEIVSDVSVEESEPEFSVTITKKGGNENGE